MSPSAVSQHGIEGPAEEEVRAKMAVVATEKTPLEAISQGDVLPGTIAEFPLSGAPASRSRC